MKKIKLSLLLLMVSTISNLNSSDQKYNEHVDKAIEELRNKIKNLEYAQGERSLGQRFKDQAKNIVISSALSQLAKMAFSQLDAKTENKVGSELAPRTGNALATRAETKDSSISKVATWAKENPKQAALGAGAVIIGSALTKQAVNKIKDMRTKSQAPQIDFKTLPSHEYEKFVKNY